ncbi:hypothetical protein [Deinococcus hopiensis]|uniref:hypothetical protein n=1 Tax=Deinococcus hopiensis TaxID=309885 RepID=UPI00111C6533|nr:hypothetical protein [Deinococcus hopiensis]
MRREEGTTRVGIFTLHLFPGLRGEVTDCFGAQNWAALRRGFSGRPTVRGDRTVSRGQTVPGPPAAATGAAVRAAPPAGEENTFFPQADRSARAAGRVEFEAPNSACTSSRCKKRTPRHSPGRNSHHPRFMPSGRYVTALSEQAWVSGGNRLVPQVLMINLPGEPTVFGFLCRPL